MNMITNVIADPVGALRQKVGAYAPAHDLPAILESILDGYVLSLNGYHSVAHWARVMENGLRIGEANGADLEVVVLFALFHDSRRINEGTDRPHGLRGGKFASSLRGELVHLSDDRFEMLYEACRLHSEGHTTEDATLGACWDADRLDLGRVGITPEADRLCTEQGRQMIEWAHARAIVNRRAYDIFEALRFTKIWQLS
ncbi:MAG: hypothetical protein LC113_02465 [Acidobacteria bacterium]|nr:hypothetical protein [Acidobacteriota bacterium]